MISGIYKIENLINNKVYIGQSKSIALRYAQHFDKDFTKSKFYLYRAMNHYGIENFSFQIVKVTYDLDYWERFFISLYRSDEEEFGYNLTSGGQKSFKREDDFEYTEEIREKMSLSKKKNWEDPIYRNKIIEAQKEGKLTDEGRKNRSEATLNMWKNGKFKNQAEKISKTMKGVKKSEETKEKMRQASVLRERRHLEDYDMYLNKGGEISYREFCKHYKKGKNDLLNEV